MGNGTDSSSSGSSRTSSGGGDEDSSESSESDSEAGGDSSSSGGQVRERAFGQGRPIDLGSSDTSESEDISNGSSGDSGTSSGSSESESEQLVSSSDQDEAAVKCGRGAWPQRPPAPGTLDLQALLQVGSAGSEHLAVCLRADAQG
jgi:hypothetical protein